MYMGAWVKSAKDASSRWYGFIRMHYYDYPIHARRLGSIRG
jgi:hypothetical protein